MMVKTLKRVKCVNVFGHLRTLRESFEGVQILLKLCNVFAKAMKSLLLILLLVIKRLRKRIIIIYLGLY